MGNNQAREFSDLEARVMRWQILHGTVRGEKTEGGYTIMYDEPIPDAPWGIMKTWTHMRGR